MKISKKSVIKKTSIIKNEQITKNHEIQTLDKIEQRISLNVDSLLVLSEEGEPTQIALASQRAKNEFLKLGPEMQRLATKLEGNLPSVVADFLESIHVILHGPGMLDENFIIYYQDAKARFRAELKHLIELK